MTLDLFATTNPDDEMGANLMAALRWHRDNRPARTGHDASLHFDESNLPDDAPRMSRRAQRDQWRPRTYRVDTDGYDNHGQRVETWEHDGRVGVIW